MLRKHLFTAAPVVSGHGSGEMDIAAIATVWVTSETAEAPIDHVFDQRHGPGGSRWVAAEPGEQRLILAFDTPQTLHTIGLEVEEPEVRRTQVLHVPFPLTEAKPTRSCGGRSTRSAPLARRLSARPGRSRLRV